jgi:hypothetical protein
MESPIVYVPAENGYVAEFWLQILVTVTLIFISFVICSYWNLDVFWSTIIIGSFSVTAILFDIFTMGGGP